MRTRGLIEQAKGRLVERLGLDPEEAFRFLAARSQQTNVAVADVAADIMGSTGTSEAEGGPEELAAHRRVVRLRASLQAAADPAQLVGGLADEDWLGARAVALFVVEADGALRLVAARGWPTSVVSDWRWIPSAVRTPAGEAIRRSTPLWLDEPDGLTVIGPGRRRAALPIVVGRTAVAALEVVFTDGTGFDPVARRHLLGAADEVASWLASSRQEEETVHIGLPERWVEAMVDTVVTPAVVLSPIWSEDATIDDFRIDHANAAASAALTAAGSAVGRRLLDVDPDLVHDGAFDACVRAVAEDAPSRPPGSGKGGLVGPPDRFRVARLGGRLMASWQAGSPAEDGATAVRVATMEQLGSFGWGEWSPSRQPVAFSPGLYRILGRPAHRGPLGLDLLLAAVAPEDRQLAESTLERVVREGHPAGLDLRLRRADGSTRVIRTIVTRRTDPGQEGAIVALFQDRTEAEEQQRSAASAAERLATERVRSAVERAQTEQLRTAFFPPPWTRHRHGPLLVVARHAAPSGLQSFRGDFYEINQSDGALMLAVGDVFGSGVAAAHTMVRLRQAARVLAFAGLGPADVLRLANRELAGDEDPPLASLVLARVDADAGTVSWAQAGHYSPILVRRERARSLRRPPGNILGLLPETRYVASTVRLEAGDLLVFFTDGVLHQLGATPIRRLAAECERAQRDGGAEALVERVLRPAQDEACLVSVQWPAPGPDI